MRALYRDAQQELDRIKASRQDFGESIENLSSALLSATDPTERRRLQQSLDTAIDLFRTLEADRARVQRNLQDIENDYSISGCTARLGNI